MSRLGFISKAFGMSLFYFSMPLYAEFSVIVEQELALSSQLHGQKMETLIEPRWDYSPWEDARFTVILRGRYDAMDNIEPSSNSDLDIRELYLDTEYLGAYWRIGRQQVVWGQADGLKVLDVVNPQSYREFILDDFDDSRIPLWMVNLELPVGDEGELQVLWIPDQTYNTFAEAGSTYEMASPESVPRIQKRTSSSLKNSDFGLKYSLFYQGWDLGVHYLFHHHDTPVFYPSAIQGEVNSMYERNHLLGTTASNAFGDFILRVEAGYSSNVFNMSRGRGELSTGVFESADASSVIGLDWQGIENTMISAQWFQSYLLDYDESVLRPRNNNIASLLYQGSFDNESWTLHGLLLYGLDQKDTSIQLKLNYMLASNIRLWVGMDSFFGSDEGLFGQFKGVDRLTVGYEWGL